MEDRQTGRPRSLPVSITEPVRASEAGTVRQTTTEPQIWSLKKAAPTDAELPVGLSDKPLSGQVCLPEPRAQIS